MPKKHCISQCMYRNTQTHKHARYEDIQMYAHMYIASPRKGIYI